MSGDDDMEERLAMGKREGTKEKHLDDNVTITVLTIDYLTDSLRLSVYGHHQETKRVTPSLGATGLAVHFGSALDMSG